MEIQWLNFFSDVCKGLSWGEGYSEVFFSSISQGNLGVDKILSRSNIKSDNLTIHLKIEDDEHSHGYEDESYSLRRSERL